MKIGIDLTYVKIDYASGIRKSGEDIINGILKIIDEKDEIVIFVDELLEKLYNNNYPKCKIVKCKMWFKNIKYIRIINILKIAKYPKILKLRKEKCDIIIHPYTDDMTPLLKKQNEIAAILDVNPFDIAKESKEQKKYIKLKDKYIKLMNKNKYITTLSEYSKKRLIEINPKYNGEITVIPCAVTELEKTSRKVEDIIDSNEKYIFTINSFYKYKNQLTLVKAFNIIKNSISHELILVGRPELDSNMSGYSEILGYIQKNNLQDRVKIYSNISDEDRNTLFYNADLFVSTSKLEGFGRTPVEAAMCEIPVISTMETSLPEATANLVYYYNNPTDENELANKIIEVINNRPTKEKLRDIAKAMKNTYNDKKIAMQYMELIKRILKNNK